MGSLNNEDYTVVIAFILATVAIPIIVGYRERERSFMELTFAGRKLGFLSMALTMFLSENGSAQLTGLAGWAVHSGLGIYAYSLVGSFGLLTLGWIFMPVYIASGVNTTIDYANKRFGGKRIGIVMVILMLFINLLSKFSAELHTTHVMLDEMFALPPMAINMFLIMGAFLVVFPGGLYSLVYTNNMQFIFFVVGIPVIFVYSYSKFMSWQEIQLRYQKSWPNTTIMNVNSGGSYKYTHCGIPDLHSLDLIRSHNDPDLPWPGMIFGIYIISVYNFCIDQSILQFCLGSKNIVHAKYACIVSSFFKVLTIFLVIPGFIARVLYTDIVACADPDICEHMCGKRSGCADLALPQLFDNLVPKGWRGPVLVAFMAATLTSLAATLHAGSTIFVINLYRPLRRNAVTEFECTIVGKCVQLVQSALGIAMVNFVNKIPSMHSFMQQIYSTMVPPLVAVYILAIFWDRVTEKIAFRTLVLGSCIAFIRLAWKLSYGFVPCGDEKQMNVPDIIANFHDLHFAIFLFTICVCFISMSGLMTDAINPIHLHRLLFWMRYDIELRIDINTVDKPFFKDEGLISVPDYSLEPNVSNFPTVKDISDVPTSTVHETDIDEIRVFETQKEVEIVKEEEEEEPVSSRLCVKCVAYSQKPLIDADHQDNMSRKLVKELSSETQTLNMMLVVLLLVIVFVMGYFK